MPRLDSTQKTIHNIETLIKNGVFIPGEYLPSIRDLARRFKVSPNTIQKAIHILGKENRLKIEKCTGVRLPGPRNNNQLLWKDTPLLLTTTNQVAKYTWEKAAVHLKKDILSNNFEHSNRAEIPSIKELKSRYHLSYHPIKKAIASLVETGIIAPDGSIALSFPHDQRFVSTIILVVDKINALDERQYNVARMLEFECKKITITLVIQDTTIGSLNKIMTLMDSHMVLGFIFFCNKTAYLEQDMRAFSRICTFKVPVAAINITDFGYSPFPRTQDNVRFFHFGTIDGAGMRVAQHLLPLGHTHIAFISCLHSMQFSVQRFTSLKKTFESAQEAHEVAPFTFDAPGFTDFPIFQSDSNQNAGPVPALKTALSGNTTYQGLFRTIEELYKIAEHEPHLSLPIAELDSSNRKVAQTDRFYYSLCPLFHKALADPRITAWVCVDDVHAFPALLFLQSIGKRVPDDISVVSFEDLPASLGKGLTTYNFNAQSLISHCLRFIQYPRSAFGKKNSGPIEITGFMMERSSSGKARK